MLSYTLRYCKTRDNRGWYVYCQLKYQGLVQHEKMLMYCWSRKAAYEYIKKIYESKKHWTDIFEGGGNEWP